MKRLADLPFVDLIKSGPFGTSLGAKEYVTAGTPNALALVSVGEIRDGFVELSDRTPWVSHSTQQRLPIFSLTRSDVIVARKGNVDRSAWVDSDNRYFLGSDGILIRCRTAIEARYVAYALQMPSTRAWLRRHAGGSTLASLNAQTLSDAPIPHASIENAQGTISILTTLDDKIAANRRIINTSATLVDALAKQIQTISTMPAFEEIAEIGGGGTPSTKEATFWNGNISWATPTDVTASVGPWLTTTTRAITDSGLTSCASPLYPEGSILMTSRATIGEIVLAAGPMAVNQGFIVVNAKNPENQTWLYTAMRARVQEFKDWANGATFMELSRGTFKKLHVTMPDPESITRFNAKARPLLKRTLAAQSENEALSRTRDELLPLLMSGKITISDAEKTVEEVV